MKAASDLAASQNAIQTSGNHSANPGLRGGRGVQGSPGLFRGGSRQQHPGFCAGGSSRPNGSGYPLSVPAVAPDSKVLADTYVYLHLYNLYL